MDFAIKPKTTDLFRSTDSFVEPPAPASSTRTITESLLDKKPTKCHKKVINTDLLNILDAASSTTIEKELEDAEKEDFKQQYIHQQLIKVKHAPMDVSNKCYMDCVFVFPFTSKDVKLFMGENIFFNNCTMIMEGDVQKVTMCEAKKQCYITNCVVKGPIELKKFIVHTEQCDVTVIRNMEVLSDVDIDYYSNPKGSHIVKQCGSLKDASDPSGYLQIVKPGVTISPNAKYLICCGNVDHEIDISSVHFVSDEVSICNYTNNTISVRYASDDIRHIPSLKIPTKKTARFVTCDRPYIYLG